MNVVIAQEANYYIHDMRQETKGDPYIISHKVLDNGEVLILKKEVIKGPGGWNYFLEKRNAEMEIISVENITAKIDGDHYFITDVYFLGDKLLIFSYFNDKSKKIDNYYTQTIDVNSLAVSSRALFHTETYEKRRRRVSFDVDLSENGAYFLITLIPPYLKGEEEKLSLMLLDQSLNLIWEELDYGLGIDDRLYSIENTVVGNNGEAFMIGVSKETGLEIRKFDGADINILEVDPLDGVERYSYIISVNKDDNLVFSGYVKEEGAFGVTGGFYMTYSSEDMELIDFHNWDFDKDMINYGVAQKRQEKIAKKEAKKNVEYGATKLSIDEVRYDEFNNMYIIGSEYWVEEHTSVDANGNTRTYYTYNYGSIYVSKVSAEGDLWYNVKIPKLEEYRFPRRTILTDLTGETLSFFYLDDPVNLNDRELEQNGIRQVGIKDAYFNTAVISPSGEVEKTKAIDFLELGYKKFRVRQVLDDPSKPLIYVYIGKKEWKLISFEAK